MCHRIGKAEWKAPREIEEQTAALWLSLGTVEITHEGSENTYYRDEFGNEFYCKNYPKPLEF